MDFEQEIQKLKQENQILFRAVVPTGTVLPFAGTTVPSDDWLLCDGSAITRVGYAGLFKVIGETYGCGDGSKTFNLPDLRGRTVVGAGQSLELSNRVIGQAIGAETHTLTAEEMPLHTHSGFAVEAGHHAHYGSIGGAGNHAHSGATAGAGSHAHDGSVKSIPDVRIIIGHDGGGGGNVGGYVRVPAEDVDGSPIKIDWSRNTEHGHAFSMDAAGEHVHGVSIDAVGDHAHGVSIDAAGAHAHNLSIDAVGGSKSHDNMQPSLPLNFIIKC